MKDNLIIVGNSDFALTMKNYIEATDWGNIECFCADREYISNQMIDNYPVYAIDDLPYKYDRNKVKLILAVGYKKMGDIKEKLMKKCSEMGFNFTNFIHPTAIVSKDVVMGIGNCILDGVIVESGVELSDANIIFGGV